ncbi:MAG: lipid-binding SYLF domain-containing protein [Campylobacterota bacterium]|nr:lipid-binding SYLF domain-containing protein [Campylobacterota bacterium]
MKIFNFKTLVVGLFLGLSTFSVADTAKELNHDANMAINTFLDETKGADAFLVNAKAFLVFPKVQEAGFFVGGKYAEGVLRVKRDTKAFYKMTVASLGFQMGAQEYSLIIAFTSDAALKKFMMDNDEWETDIDGKITIAEWNSKEELDDVDFKDDMVAFVYDTKGLMGSFTMEGTRFEKIKK